MDWGEGTEWDRWKDELFVFLLVRLSRLLLKVQAGSICLGLYVSLC